MLPQAAVMRTTPASSTGRRPRTALLPDELTDTILIIVLVARPIAAVDVADLALAVDDHRARHLIDVVGLAHLIGGVEQHGEAHGFAREQLLHRRRVLVHVHPDEREARRFVLLVHLVEERHLLLERPA